MKASSAILGLLAVLFVAGTLTSGQSLYDCVSTDSRLASFAAYYNFSDATAFLKTAGGSLFAFRNGVDTSGANGFTLSEKLNNLRYQIASTQANIASFGQQPKSSTYLVDSLFANLGGDPQVIIVSKPSGQAQYYVNGYAAVTTADVACGANFIHIVESFVYMPAIVTDVLDYNKNAYQVKSYLGLINSNNLNNTLNGAKRTVLALTDAALTGVTVSTSQLTQLVLNGPVYSGSITTTPFTVKSVDGVSITVVKTSTGTVTVSIGTKTANVVRADILSRGGVIHVIDAALPLGSTSSGTATGSGSGSDSNAAAPSFQTNILVSFALTLGLIFFASVIF